EELVSLLRERKVTSAELVEQAIARIEALDEKTNAVIVRDFDRAREAAKLADEAINKGDQRPLLGIPMTVKESYNVGGLPTTWRIEQAKDNIAAKDSVPVKRLKDAGAIILGKTNVSYLLIDWQSANPVYGVANNPWDQTRTPGGSSGGSAAALAAGFTPLELGSDIGGSLRMPASFCGVYSLKPTYNLVPSRGHTPPVEPVLSVGARVDFAVGGPLARSADDLDTALKILAAPDDMKAKAYKLELPEPRHDNLKDFKVLVLDEHPLAPTDDAVKNKVNGLADKLTDAGCQISRQSELLPDLSLMGRTYLTMLMSFFSANLPDEVYARELERAKDLSDDDLSIEASMLRGSTLSHRDWVRTDRIRTGVVDKMNLFFREFDVILCPVSPSVAFPHDHSHVPGRKLMVNGKEISYLHQSMWISIATLSGFPATTMPVGLNNDGMPIGAQVIGPYLEDRTTIRFASLVEKEFGGFIRPEGY
ncbi:MAG: amidase, partial [Methyloligellaceae bacterium]